MQTHNVWTVDRYVLMAGDVIEFSIHRPLACIQLCDAAVGIHAMALALSA